MVNLWPWPRGQHWLDYTHINDWTPVRLIAWLASRYTHDLISSVNCNLLVFLIHSKNIDRSSIQCINGTCINIKVFRPFSLLELNGTGNLFYKCFILTMSSHLLNCSAQVLIFKKFLELLHIQNWILWIQLCSKNRLFLWISFRNWALKYTYPKRALICWNLIV